MFIIFWYYNYIWFFIIIKRYNGCTGVWQFYSLSIFNWNYVIFIVILWYSFNCVNAFMNEWFKPNLNNTTICQLQPFWKVPRVVVIHRLDCIYVWHLYKKKFFYLETICLILIQNHFITGFGTSCMTRLDWRTIKPTNHWALSLLLPGEEPCYEYEQQREQ